MIKLDNNTRNKLNLSLNDLALLIELEQLKGKEFKVQEMYKFLGISKNTYYNQLRRLILKGYVNKGRMFYKGEKRVAQYQINDKLYNDLNNKNK